MPVRGVVSSATLQPPFGIIVYRRSHYWSASATVLVTSLDMTSRHRRCCRRRCCRCRRVVLCRPRWPPALSRAPAGPVNRFTVHCLFCVCHGRATVLILTRCCRYFAVGSFLDTKSKRLEPSTRVSLCTWNVLFLKENQVLPVLGIVFVDGSKFFSLDLLV